MTTRPMTTTQPSPFVAASPEDLEPAFAAAVAAGDLDAIVGLYAADAVVSLPRGREAAGHPAIREAFAAALAAGVLPASGACGEDAASVSAVSAVSVRALVTGDLAMTTSSRADGSVCTQVARRGADGGWLWVRDGSRLRDADACLPSASGDLVVA
ncbi:MAG TPA: nuclear transport factor 2 family protein [Terrabacter sp.]|nr:nuclear transport factor 2 family protein [Terrabacter sp.]